MNHAIDIVFLCYHEHHRVSKPSCVKISQHQHRTLNFIQLRVQNRYPSPFIRSTQSPAFPLPIVASVKTKDIVHTLFLQLSDNPVYFLLLGSASALMASARAWMTSISASYLAEAWAVFSS